MTSSCTKLLAHSQNARCLSAGRFASVGPWSAERHQHAFSEMMVILGGVFTIETGNGKFRLRAGDVLVYPPSTPHVESIRAHEAGELIYCAFNGPALPTGVLQDSRGRVRLLMQWLVEEQASNYARKQESIDALLQSSVAECVRLTAQTAETLVEKVRIFMRGHLSEEVTVGALARHAHLSQAHFIRTYKRLTGRTPMEDLRVQRVEAARDLIMTSQLPMKSIAPRVGFCDEYHLSRVFAQVLRVPPSYFRRGHPGPVRAPRKDWRVPPAHARGSM